MNFWTKNQNRVKRRINLWQAKRGNVTSFVERCIEQIEIMGASSDTHKKEGDLRILALNPDRFISDLEILSGTPNIEVYRAPFSFQKEILDLFWPMTLRKQFADNPGAANWGFYYHPEDPEIIQIQEVLRDFLRKFLTELYDRLQIDCVISAAVWYRQDYDWGLVSDELGIPYIVMHKENTEASSGLIKRVMGNLKGLKPFKGSQIIVFNQHTKNIFIGAGYVDENKVEALGCLRMDDFAKRVKAYTQKSTPIKANQKRQAVFFSFQRGKGLLGLCSRWPEDRSIGLTKLFEKTHQIFGLLAQKYPEVNFIYKIKFPLRTQGGLEWKDEIVLALEKIGLNYEEIPNLVITSDGNAHDMIFESDVVVSYGSTTIFEAATLKPCIVPHFEEIVKPEYAEYVFFREDLPVLNIAYCPDELRDKIEKEICSDTQEKPNEQFGDLFEKYVSSLSSDALEKYIRCISSTVTEAKSKRTSVA